MEILWIVSGIAVFVGAIFGIARALMGSNASLVERKTSIIIWLLGISIWAILAWLYYHVGWWASLIVVLLVVSFVWQLANRTGNQNECEASPESEAVPSDFEFHRRGWKIDSWFNQEILQDALAVRGGWEITRRNMQKISYSMVKDSIPREQKRWFNEFMKVLVARDPLYIETIDRVTDALKASPGITQSEIYKGRTEKEKEGARYILYFAHELGDIERVKSGRSYRLFLPGQSPTLHPDNN